MDGGVGERETGAMMRREAKPQLAKGKNCSWRTCKALRDARSNVDLELEGNLRRPRQRSRASDPDPWASWRLDLVHRVHILFESQIKSSMAFDQDSGHHEYHSSTGIAFGIQITFPLQSHAQGLLVRNHKSISHS